VRARRRDPRRRGRPDPPGARPRRAHRRDHRPGRAHHPLRLGRLRTPGLAGGPGRRTDRLHLRRRLARRRRRDARRPHGGRLRRVRANDPPHTPGTGNLILVLRPGRQAPRGAVGRLGPHPLRPRRRGTPDRGDERAGRDDSLRLRPVRPARVHHRPPGPHDEPHLHGVGQGGDADRPAGRGHARRLRRGRAPDLADRPGRRAPRLLLRRGGPTDPDRGHGRGRRGGPALAGVLERAHPARPGPGRRR